MVKEIEFVLVIRVEDEFDEGAGELKEDGLNLFLEVAGLGVIVRLDEAQLAVLLVAAAPHKYLDELGDFILVEHYLHVFRLHGDVELNRELLGVGAVDVGFPAAGQFLEVRGRGVLALGGDAIDPVF